MSFRAELSLCDRERRERFGGSRAAEKRRALSESEFLRSKNRRVAQPPPRGYRQRTADASHRLSFARKRRRALPLTVSSILEYQQRTAGLDRLFGAPLQQLGAELVFAAVGDFEER